jgi:exodeoxyribonuclease VII large subunit
MSKKEDFITVTELNKSIQSILTTSIPDTLKVNGEISNIKLSGQNTYLTLKDGTSSINVVAWAMKFDKIQNGDDVIVTGKINCFQKQGSYQILAYKIERIGIGNLHEKYEKSKKAFESKGLFSKKRDFPDSINRIGILTASEGAALQDIMYVLKSNLFSGEIYVKNCVVQGQQCPQSVSDGINYFNKLNKVKPFDVLIISRGGGSFEDLMGYSSKEVVKAIYDSDIFTISAVGHEIDTMLSDYTADYRAPTPSVAAEVVSAFQKENKEKLLKLSDNLQNLKSTIKNKLLEYENNLVYCKKILFSTNPVNYIDTELTKIEDLKDRLVYKIKYNIEHFNRELDKIKNKCEAYNITRTMNKGYSIITDDKGTLITSKKVLKECIKNKQKIKVFFSDGEYDLSSLIEK